MRHLIRYGLALCILGLSASIVFGAATSESYNRLASLWTAILTRETVEGERNSVQSTLVKYDQIADSQSFSGLLRFVALTPQPSSDSPEYWPYYLNVYHIAVVAGIADHYPISQV
ncbi:hypothetical protein EBR96_04265, partial [bacterium]|nr:hypothetical protein [bacterium]